jgi:hypothetical protein
LISDTAEKDRESYIHIRLIITIHVDLREPRANLFHCSDHRFNRRLILFKAGRKLQEEVMIDSTVIHLVD